MGTSRPIRRGEWLLSLRGVAIQRIATGQEAREDFVLQEDFGIHRMDNVPFWILAGERVFAVPSVRVGSDPRLAAAITNGTAPGLYVREGDDTSDWETYRRVLARRVEEAMAARRGEASGGETATAETTTRQEDEIRVGDVIEVVSNTSAYTTASDVGGGGRITRIENSNNVRTSYVYLKPCQGWRLPVHRCAGLPDVRKVASPSLSPQTVAVTFSPMPDGEAARIATPEETRSRMTAQGHIVNNPSPPTDARTSINFVDVPTISAAEAYRRFATDDRRLSNIPQLLSRPTPQPSSPQPSTPPSRFSLLEVDLPPEPTSQISRSLDTDLAALQEELRVEQERNRAQAAAQMQKSRFDLLECDLPAVPVAAVPAVAVRASSPRPVVSSSLPPRPRNPVETITNLTAARSPLELARMLEGLNDELLTLMRQREAN